MPDAPVKDARNRTWRTFLQGLVAAVLMGTWPVVQATMNAGLQSVDWSVMKWSLVNAAVTAGVTFLWRTFLDPSKVPSANPPGEG